MSGQREHERAWALSDKIAAVGVVIAAIACLAAVAVVPEVRAAFGLDHAASNPGTPRPLAAGAPEGTSSPPAAYQPPTPQASPAAAAPESTSSPSAAYQPPTPKASAAAAKPPIPAFQGTVGHFANGTAFNQFVVDHVHEIVNLDVTVPGDAYDGGSDNQLDWFVLYDDCYGGIPPGQPPDATHCTGTEYNIPQNSSVLDSGFFISHGDWHLTGWFVDNGCEGPHQGLMGCMLRPLNLTDVHQ